MTSKTVFIAIALCCMLVIAAMTGVISPMSFAVTSKTPNASVTQTTNCWVNTPCNPATDFAYDD